MSSSIEGPIPFFGIGAMRGGTSWLWDLLKRYPDCRVCQIKEMHFFDCRYGLNSGHKVVRGKTEKLVRNATAVHEAVGKMRDQLYETSSANPGLDPAAGGLDDEDEQELAVPDAPVFQGDDFRRRLFRRLQVGRSVRKISEILEYLSIQDMDSYAAFLRKDAEGAAAFGEITPSYALLPAAAFAEIDGAFPGARFIFILRDPVDRLWSHVRYIGTRGRRKRSRGASELNDLFRRALAARNFIARSCYSETIKTLEGTIPQDRILYLFYETMVSPDTGPAEIRRIETFLNLQPLDPADLLHESKNAANPRHLDPDNRSAAFDLLRPEYEFVAQRFGVQEKWRRLA